MFTGLVELESVVSQVSPREGGLGLFLDRPKGFENLKLGESIAVDGVCLTLTQFDETSMLFFVGQETLDKTTFKDLKEQKTVNLERSLAFGDRLGGHLVSGHVDGTAEVVRRFQVGECLGLEFRVDQALTRWIVPKGSICVNGVSLTVNSVSAREGTFSVLLIPETLKRTNLAALKEANWVNIEYDQMVKIIVQQVERYGVRNEFNL